MSQTTADLERADRLTAITQRVGFCIWQLQELEASAARFLVLTTRLTPSTSKDEGVRLADKAISQTFGANLRGLAAAKVLPEELQSRDSLIYRRARGTTV
jgi:hypothetical protein